MSPEPTSTEFAATGRRKTAVARVHLTPGPGHWKINGREFDKYFPLGPLRTFMTQPLALTGTEGKLNVLVRVRGGGPSGQAGAIRHGIARALLAFDATLRPTLRKNGFLTRDPRMKERKKYGQPGARKRFQFSKR